MTHLTNDLLFEHYCVEINIIANSINIDVLNKHYIEKLKSVITDKILLRCYSDKYQGFAYIALVNNAQLMFRKTIFQNPKNEGIFSDKIPKLIPTKRKNKYIYSFEIDSLILRIGKISTEEANGKSKILFTPFDREEVLKRASKYIDLASIEFVSNKRMEEYNKKPNYYPFLSKIIKSGGTYYIKLIDKQQSIKELVKKKNIYKIDKKYYLNHNPNYNLFKSIENKISIINMLPISQYTKRKGYTNKICCFEL